MAVAMALWFWQAWAAESDTPPFEPVLLPLPPEPEPELELELLSSESPLSLELWPPAAHGGGW